MRTTQRLRVHVVRVMRGRQCNDAACRAGEVASVVRRIPMPQRHTHKNSRAVIPPTAS